MFDRTHALFHRKTQVFGRHVVLVVNKRLGAPRLFVGRQLFVHHARTRTILVHGIAGRVTRLAQCIQCGLGLCRAICQRCFNSPQATARARDHAVSGRIGRQESGQVIVPRQFALRVRKQVQRRRPATGHQHSVTLDFRARADCAARDLVHA